MDIYRRDAPEGYETLDQFCERTGISKGMAGRWAAESRIPGAKKFKKVVCKNTVINCWFFKKDSWPDLSTFHTRIPRNLKLNHPELKDWISTREYADKYGYNPNYVYLIWSGRTRSTPPIRKKVGGVCFVPRDWTHKNQGRVPGHVSFEVIQEKKDSLRSRGYLTVEEVKDITGFGTVSLRKACERGVIENVVWYQRWYIHQSNPIVTDNKYRLDKKITRLATKDMCRMSNEGMSIRKIAEHYGIGKSTVQQRVSNAKRGA